jgi:thiol-disulfide isomerase/thioredoxin
MSKFFLVVFFSCVACLRNHKKKMEPNFKVSCYLKGSNGKKIILGNKPASGTNASFKVNYYDSCYSVNDSFEFVFYREEPSWYSIEIEGKKGWQSFVAVPDIDITIIGNSDSLYKSKILGSKEDSLYNFMSKDLLSPLYNAMYKSAPDSFKTIYPRLIREAKYNFIRQNSGSFISASYLVQADSYNRITDTAQLHYLQKCYMALSAQAKQFTCTKNAYYNLFVAPKKLTTQNKIPNFGFINYDGSRFDLFTEIKKGNKSYYLIDFWATWCAPCIAQFPKLKEVYRKFKSLGIIGYSLDIDKSKLLSYLQKNNLEWKVISDLKGEQSEIYKLFKLGTIPSNYLVDSNGIIMQVNVKPEELDKIINEGFRNF